MAEITFADYTGYLVLEIVKARQMADDYSRTVALAYAKDPVMQHFPAPRFKLPKVELTVPVLVSRARYSSTARFVMPQDAFVAAMEERLDGLVRRVRSEVGVVRPGLARRALARSRQLRPALVELHGRLTQAAEEQQIEAVVTELWSSLADRALVAANLREAYKRKHPRNEPVVELGADVRAMVAAATAIDRTRIDSLLVEPETAAVRNGSNPASVFSIKVELIEEGVHVRSVVDEQTGETRAVVDFE